MLFRSRISRAVSLPVSASKHSHSREGFKDERARRILLNCRGAVPDDGVLLLMEYCLGGENTPTVGKTVDVVMLTMTGGKERTVREHRELLTSAGFSLNETVPLSQDVMILEARPA